MTRALVVLLAALAVSVRCHAQADTTRPRVLEPVMVTADRASGTPSASIASATILEGQDLVRLPRATLADLLRMVPGFTLVDFDGLGFDPQIMVRGFYGGGEAEYVVVMVDGVPVNRLETGVVAWDALPPLSTIDAIEIVRGGGSSLYGDAAIGGVINVRTRRSGSGSHVVGGGSGGSYGTWRGDAEVVASADGRNVRLGIGIDRTGGWREHAERTTARARAVFPLIEATHGWLRVSATAHRRDYEEPGPLLESEVEENRRGSESLFRLDRTTDNDGAALLTGEWSRSGRRASGMLGVELRSVDAIRTLVLAPGFGDTKEREATSHRASAGIQVEGDGPIAAADRLVVGLEGSFGGLDSKYYLPGDASTGPSPTTWQRGDLDTHGTSSRAGGAGFAEYSIEVGRARISAGARLDILRDHFEPRTPAEADHSTTHHAFSPRAGVNIRWIGNQGSRSTGTLYFAVNRSFKAPTLDQLYDQRTIPVPFPPFQLQTSNPDLSPQHGTNLEAGLYHRAQVGEVTTALSVSAYHTAMTDELDFDLNSFQYVNIGKSRHRGIEAGFRADGSRGALFSSYTLQAAISRSGANAGRRLKAIPRHTLSIGGSIRPFGHGALRSVEISALATGVKGIYLDDANTARLPGYTRMDLRMTVGLDRVGLSLFADVRNLFAARFSSSGYLDPSGSGEAYLYPAAGRVFEAGVRW